MALDQQAAHDRLGRHATSGVMWLAAQKWVVRASGFATLVVLTHHVSPRDFGVVAAAMTVIPMIYLLSDVGFSTYLLQSTDTDRRSLSTAFWTTMAAGAVLSTILWLTALRRDGVHVRGVDFLRIGLWVMPPALVLALAAVIA